MSTQEITLIPKCPGIYYFRNIINDKYYIGQAKNLYKRIRQHITRFRNKRIKNSIYRALEKYGFDNFEFKILKTFENIPSDELQKILDETEIKYIKQFNSYNDGYNQTTGGRGVKNYNYTKVAKKKISEAVIKVSHDGRNKIYFYDVITKEYGEELTLNDFNEKHNIKTKMLSYILIHKRYIIARSKEQLEQKIQEYYNKNKNNGRFVSKLTKEMIDDIKNQIKCKDFCKKYDVCKQTYLNYKNAIELNKKRYALDINLEVYKEYRMTHSQKETAKYFRISAHTVSSYDIIINSNLLDLN